jgi:signal transduction histidine kinase
MRAVEALAEEQRRMRRDLHDGLGPVLAGLRLTIGTARRLILAKPGEADQMLADAQNDAVAAIEDVRRLAHDLRPPSLDELGLAEALRDRLDRLADGEFQLTFVATGVPDRLPAAVEVAIYRIGSEAVLNAVRHAQADSCTVRLRSYDAGLELTVTDDGVGGVVKDHGAGVGLRSMRERAEELGGLIDVDGPPGHGTAIRVWLPCPTLTGIAS